MERTVLRRSIAVSAVLGLLGVGWGRAAGSQVILLDGMYGVVGIATSGLLLKAHALVRHALREILEARPAPGTGRDVQAVEIWLSLELVPHGTVPVEATA